MILDKIPRENPLFIIIFILSLIGTYDIISEISKDYDNILSQNIVKKILTFAAIYIKTSSIYLSSLISLIMMLIFRKVYFGPQTSVKQPSSS